MGVSKVSLDGTTLIDLSTDTLTDASIAYGEQAVTPNGELTDGSAQKDNEDAIVQGTVSGVYYNPNVTYKLGSCFQGTAITKAIFPNAKQIGYRAFMNCRSLEEVEAPNVMSFGMSGIACQSFSGCNKLKEVKFPKVTVISGDSTFVGCTLLEDTYLRNVTYCAPTTGWSACNALKTLAMPKVTGTSQFPNQCFQNCNALTAVDAGYANQLTNAAFKNDSVLETLILRKTSICTLANSNVFDGTPLASGGAGVTIYIPKSLYDALGTGTNDYTTATNWSTINNRGTITWAQIEGSIYENNSVDGLPIDYDDGGVPEKISLNGVYDYGERGSITVTNDNEVTINALLSYGGSKFMNIARADGEPLFYVPANAKLTVVSPPQNSNPGLGTNGRMAFYLPDGTVWHIFGNYYSSPTKTNGDDIVAISAIGLSKYSAGTETYNIEITIADYRVV